MNSLSEFWKSGDLKDLYESRVFDRFQNQGARRPVAMAFVAAALAFPLVAWLTDSPLWLSLMMLPFTVLAIVLDGSVRGLTEIRTADLDERQRGARDHIYRPAYFVGVLIAMLGAFWIGTLISTNSVLAGGVLLFLAGFLGALPALMLAWTLPTEVVDEG